MNLKDRKAVVTGGSRGLGLGIVEALVEAEAQVTVVARTSADLERVASRLGVAVICADVVDQAAARRILSELKPDVLVLNAGAPPEMLPLEEQTWESFSGTWETDVRGGLYWVQGALQAGLAPGSRVLLSSSGAALNGSPLSGGYAGAKWMLWMLARYANATASERGLGLHFQAIVPQQIIGGTGIGEVAARAYSRKLGLSLDQFLGGFGKMLPPRQVGDYVVEILSQESYTQAVVLGLKGDTGISVLECGAA